MPSPLEILQGGIGDPYQATPLPKTPVHMTPGVDWRPGKAEGEASINVEPGEEPDWSKHLEYFGFGEQAEFLEVTRVRGWSAQCKPTDEFPDGIKKMRHITARVVKMGVVDRIDVEKLGKKISRWRLKPPPLAKQLEDYGLFAALADWQVGKREGGGTKALIARVRCCLERLVHRILETHPSELVLAGMGDLFEGCGDHYPMGTWTIDATRRMQGRVIRRLLLEIIKRVAPLVPKVTVMCVGGNHGENRRNGKAFTTFGDNDDVAVFEQVMEICRENRALDHVEWIIPDQELTATVDICGTPVGITHGQVCQSYAKVRAWWAKMSLQERPVGRCKILVSAHWHHLIVQQIGLKTWFQSPPNDGGSQWWEERGGEKTMPGILTVLIGKSLGPAEWDGVKIV